MGNLIKLFTQNIGAWETILRPDKSKILLFFYNNNNSSSATFIFNNDDNNSFVITFNRRNLVYRCKIFNYRFLLKHYTLRCSCLGGKQHSSCYYC